MQLLTDRASIESLAQSSRLVVLIGSYDGNPNFGDVMQLSGALDALHALRPLITPMIVIEAESYQEHLRIASAYPEVFADTIIACFIDDGKELDPSGLERLPHIASADPACIYFYGGGYANNLWGQRKAMLASGIMDWLSQTGKRTQDLPVFITGVQIEPSLLAEEHPLLHWFRKASFCRLRDPESSRLLEPELPIATAGTDDALPVLIDAVSSGRPAEKDPFFTVGIHFNAEPYAAGRADTIQASLEATLTELKERVHGKLILRQILAYEGGWVRESIYSNTISDLAIKIGADIGEPIDISIGTNTSALGSLHAAISCSYHTTMATCLRSIPTLMVVRNEYYEQKLQGLRVWFQEDLLGMLSKNSDPATAACFLSPEFKPKANLLQLSVLCRADTRRSSSAIGAVLVAAIEAEVAALARISLEASAEASRLRGLIGTHLLVPEYKASTPTQVDEQNNIKNVGGIPPAWYRRKMWRRMVFHSRGKPRGWVRFLVLKDKTGTPRPALRRFLFKKNGVIRPQFAAWHSGLLGR
ncbi:hypothetical protein INT08_06185 [Prosthecochloris sp. N3]|uniref:Polysaccharide pyruvyl transferase domain-containing protein n=1 Tax=Prosthecochloris ethylica TaxID=2743976 RepID=A0ABR9XS42_9CHLB|nr:hypothetical protein [Prosthecochloris ethylica]MBF0586889.1 hypothetical protein [Prosthecochloris ethylica]MBF0636763.1 hypothetical protein [Prosthecochloris ethylica]NUK47979.1 hypothetical protein [Prosthecochloris ethylica]